MLQIPATACPIATEATRSPWTPVPDPTPENLSYSLTLPAAPASATLARAATRTALHLHGLTDVTDPVVQAVSELAACATRFTTADDIYVSLRHRDAAIRIVLYDSHPRHAHPRLSEACDARRRATLRVLGAVVRTCGGNWGFGAAREPGGGTRMWVVLPIAGARAYGNRAHSRTGELGRRPGKQADALPTVAL